MARAKAPMPATTISAESVRLIAALIVAQKKQRGIRTVQDTARRATAPANVSRAAEAKLKVEAECFRLARVGQGLPRRPILIFEKR
jgi:hypothetical protein